MTFAPPAGAGPFSVTVPTAVSPLERELGLTVKPINKSGLIVNDALKLVFPRLAPIVDIVEVVTCAAATEKVTKVAPAETVTFAGTVALELLELSVMTRPAAGAGLLMATVPVEVDPPVMVLGANVIELRTGAAIARGAVAVVP